MPTSEKKGITVQIDAELHTQVKQYLEEHNMKMADFVALALQDELTPKNQEKEENDMANMRTMAFQVPEELFQKIKDYLHRNNITQKQFVLGLIEQELERDLKERADIQDHSADQEEDAPEELHDGVDTPDNLDLTEDSEESDPEEELTEEIDESDHFDPQAPADAEDPEERDSEDETVDGLDEADICEEDLTEDEEETDEMSMTM